MALPFEHSLLPRGTGPVATVYRATPDTGGQTGAIKVYPGPLDRSTIVELLEEQRTLAGLRNVSSILLIDETEELPDGRAAIRMELCSHSLDELVESTGPLPVSEVVVLAETIAGVLVDAHAAGIVHGGVTPTNVLYRRAGQPVLADFGLELRQCFPRAPEAAAAYTAPEVLRGAEPAEPADLYGLGAVLYLALTGAAPFAPRPGEPTAEVLLRALGESPALLGRDLPAALSDVVTTLLVKDPAERPGSAAEVLERLRELHAPETARPTPDLPAAWTVARPEGRTADEPSPPTRFASPATPEQPAPSSALPPSPPGPAPSSPLPSSPEGSPVSPLPDSARTRPRDRRERQGTRWHRHPLLLATPAVLAVLAVLLGVLGGGGSPGRTTEDATAADRDTSRSARSADSEAGGAPDSDRRKDDGTNADEPDTGRSDMSEDDERQNDAPDATPPTTEASSPESVELEIHRVRDHGSTVDLTWRSDEPLTYAVFVAEQGGDSASAKYRGTGTTLTVSVQPDLQYCFQVQGTDGNTTFQSPPRGIRGATCRS